MDISSSYVFIEGTTECCVMFHACFYYIIEGDTKHEFLVHGQILTTSCSSNEVGTIYFNLRWEERIFSL